jgi:predicted lipid carrier protein YhbT
VPGPHANADALITGRAPQLALVAGGRLDPDEAFASGNVVVGGNTALALTVLRNLRAYPERVAIRRLSPGASRSGV